MSNQHAFSRIFIQFFSQAMVQWVRFGTSFLVGAFLVKRARLLQWLVFFSSDYNPHSDWSTFLTTETTKTTKA